MEIISMEIGWHLLASRSPNMEALSKDRDIWFTACETKREFSIMWRRIWAVVAREMSSQLMARNCNCIWA